MVMKPEYLILYSFFLMVKLDFESTNFLLNYGSMAKLMYELINTINSSNAQNDLYIFVKNIHFLALDILLGIYTESDKLMASSGGRMRG